MFHLLKNKVAIVTGGSRGIGASIVTKLVQYGADVAFTYRNEASYEKSLALINSLKSYNQKVLAYQSNAGEFKETESFVQQVINDFGGIDICINNAGINKDNLLIRMKQEDWHELMHVNLQSVFNMTRNVANIMRKKGEGNIINISSIIGMRGNAGQSSYAASKAGIIGFTKSIAHELGRHNIRCNAIAPGFIDTDMTKEYMQEGRSGNQLLKVIPLSRFGKPEEVANTALFLASDQSSYINGQVISVCGGLNT